MADQLSDKIRIARAEAGLSREALAVALDVSLATVVRYETGRTTRISIGTVQVIAAVTGKPVEFFFQEAAA